MFFPFIDDPKNEIGAVFCLGDTFDRRKYTNHVSLHAAKEMLFQPMVGRRIPFHIVIGNHDCPYKNSNEINTVDLMVADLGMQVYTYKNPREIVLDGTKILMLPWICSDNFEASFDMIKKSDAPIAMGHLELAGFEMYRGIAVNTGYDHKLFSKFDTVLSGHFHHKSSRDNIHYLGSPYEMTWSDYDDARGFHVLDTNTRELKFYQNPNHLFYILHYNDEGKDLSQLLSEVVPEISGSYVKVIAHKKTNPYWFDNYIKHIEDQEVVDLQIIEELQANSENFEVGATEDTLTLIRRYVSSQNEEAPIEEASELMDLMTELYHAAQ